MVIFDVFSGRLINVINNNGVYYPQVDTFADLPAANTKTDKIYVVEQASGDWYTFNRKDAGLYHSNGVTWTKLNNIPYYFDSGNFRIQDSIDSSKQLAHNIAAFTTGTTRTVTWQDKNITVAGINNETFTGTTNFSNTRTTGTKTVSSTGSILIFNTADETTNYERVKHFWSSNIYTISTENGGTGSSTRNISISAGGTTRLTGSTRSFVIGNTGNTGFFNFAGGTGLAGNSTVGVNGTLTNSSLINTGYNWLATINQSGTGGYRGVWISPFEQATGSGIKYLIDAGTNSAGDGGGTHTSKFIVENTGATTSTATVTASGALARAVYINPTLTAAANNDVLVGLDIDPTFTVGAFTGVQQIGIRVKGNVFPSVSNTYVLGSGSFIWSSINVNTTLTGTIRPNNTDLSFFSANGATRYAQMINATGNFIFQNGGTFTDDTVNRIQVTGSIKATTDIESGTIASGFVGKSPDGTRYRATFANGGTWSIAAV